ncbi:MAG: c-type cytochrome [Methylophilaceae bacterium]
MHKSIFQFLAFVLLASSLALPIFGLAAEDVVTSTPEQITLHTRVLAASCAACHGTQGNAVTGSTTERNAVLAGKDRADFISKMQGFRDGSRKSTVMHHHAKGLTEAEINQLADFFAQQKPNNATPLTPQTLKAGHD